MTVTVTGTVEVLNILMPSPFPSPLLLTPCLPLPMRAGPEMDDGARRRVGWRDVDGWAW